MGNPTAAELISGPASDGGKSNGPGSVRVMRDLPVRNRSENSIFFKSTSIVREKRGILGHAASLRQTINTTGMKRKKGGKKRV